MLKGGVFKRGKVGPNVTGQPFKTSGLLALGVAIAGTGNLALATTYKLLSVADAEAIGLTAAYDTTNNLVLYRHIVDFYDEAPNGTPLYLRVEAQSTTLANLIDDATGIYAKKMMFDAKGEIYQMGIAFNPAAGYTETVTDGMNSDVRAAIVKLQALWQWSVDNFMECCFFLEGRNYGGNATSALDLRAIPATPSGIQDDHKVSIVIGQDYTFAHTLTGLAQKHAGIGKFLGSVAAGDLNQDPAEVESRNLTRELNGRWISAGLSNHTTIESNASSVDTLVTKGYIFADTYGSGVSGYRWSGDATCSPVIIDAEGNMNEHKITYSRTMIHLSRELRSRMLPEVRKVKPVDPNNGKMAPGVIEYLNGKGNDVMEDFKAKGWITEGAVATDPDSDILTPPYAVDMSFAAVPYGTIGIINGTVNLKKQI
jgi:hypothetical protein